MKPEALISRYEMDINISFVNNSSHWIQILPFHLRLRSYKAYFLKCWKLTTFQSTFRTCLLQILYLISLISMGNWYNPLSFLWILHYLLFPSLDQKFPSRFYSQILPTLPQDKTASLTSIQYRRHPDIVWNITNFEFLDRARS